MSSWNPQVKGAPTFDRDVFIFIANKNISTIKKIIDLANNHEWRCLLEPRKELTPYNQQGVSFQIVQKLADILIDAVIKNEKGNVEYDLRELWYLYLQSSSYES